MCKWSSGLNLLSEGVAMPIDNESIDNLLKDYKPEEI